MKKLSLSTQIIIIVCICLIVIPTLLFLFVYPVYKRDYIAKTYDTLTYQLKLTQNDHTEFMNSLLILSPNGDIKLSSIKAEDENVTQIVVRRMIQDAINHDVGEGYDYLPFNEGGVYYAYKIYEDKSARVVYTSSFTKDTLFGNEQSIRFILLSSLFFLFPILFIMIWFANISRSINSISKSLTTNNKTYVASKEIQTLKDAIDVYKGEIQNDKEERQRLFQNISHELKTPITTIRMYAEGIEDGIYKDGDVKNSTKIIKEETDVLLDRVTKIMNINKLYHTETNQIPVGNDKIVISEIIFEEIDKYTKRAPNVIFEVKLEKGEWRGNREVWINIIDNIFDNNIKHGAKNILLVLTDKTLTIENDGERIPPEILNKLFDPFIKGEKGNFGLGLNIIQRSLKLLNYTIEIKNTNNGVVYIIK